MVGWIVGQVYSTRKYTIYRNIDGAWAEVFIRHWVGIRVQAGIYFATQHIVYIDIGTFVDVFDKQLFGPQFGDKRS